jgi:hypothetical protein
LSVTFAGLSPSEKVAAIDHVVDHLRGRLPDLPLPSATWLERMEHALAATVSEDAYSDLEQLWLAFLDRLPVAERADLEDRLATFARVLRAAPSDARCDLEIVVACLDRALETGQLA